MQIWRVAWRNLGRNWKRTAITFAAMFLSTALLIVSYALIFGMIGDMENSITDLMLGEVQVHHRSYLTERSIYDTVSDPGAILDAAHEAGIAASARAFGFGLLSGGIKSAGAQFWGIDPAAERAVSDLPTHLFAGQFLDNAPPRSMVLGKKLARALDADVGAELIVVVQAADGSLGNDMYTVIGILKSAGEGIDRSLAMVSQSDFEALFMLPGQRHEIVLNSRGSLTPEGIRSILAPAIGTNAAQTWMDLLPSIARMLESMTGMILIFGAVFFLAAGLGILNTMLMATYERIPEFGLIKAIGASPWRIMKEVTAEALVLCAVASVAGGVAGCSLALYFQYHPIDLSGFAEGFNTSGVVFSARWRAALTPFAVFYPVLMMWVVSLFAAIYPASKAARIDPIRAMTHV